MTDFEENVQKTKFLIPLHTRIKIFFRIPALSLSFLYWPSTSCKVSEKTNGRFPRYSKTDRRMDQQGRLLWTLSGKPEVQNMIYLFQIKCQVQQNVYTSALSLIFPGHFYTYIDIEKPGLCRYFRVVSKWSSKKGFCKIMNFQIQFSSWSQ